MKTKCVYVFFVLVLVFKASLGCHRIPQPSVTTTPSPDPFDYDDDQERLRRKRDIEDGKDKEDEDDIRDVIEYFVECMRPYLWRRKLDVTTTIRFTITETLWFQKTDEAFCKEQDTAECWIHLLSKFINQNSKLLSIGAYCIKKFAEDRDEEEKPSKYVPVSNKSVQPYYGRRRRQAIIKIPVDEAAILSQLQRALPRGIGDIPTLIALAKDDMKCSPEICNCSGVYIPSGETCGQFWYTRIASLTRLDKGTRPVIGEVMKSAIVSVERKAQEDRERRRCVYFRFLIYCLYFPSEASTPRDILPSLLQDSVSMINS